MAIKKTRVVVTTTGSAGSATGTGVTEFPIRGWIEAVKLDYSGDAPGTTDLTMVQTNELKAANIVNLPNNKTDKVLYPRAQVHNSGGTALTMDGTEPLVTRYPVCDTLTLALDDCDALDPALTAEIYWESEYGA